MKNKTNKQLSNPSGSQPKKSSLLKNTNHKKKIIAIVLGLILFAVLATLALVQPWSSKKNVSVCSSESSTPIYLKATEFIPVTADTNLQDFGVVVNEIKQVPEYKEHINCLYPVMMYELNQGNTDIATEMYSTFKDQQSQGQSIDARYSSVISEDTFNWFVDQINQAKEQQLINQSNNSVFFR